MSAVRVFGLLALGLAGCHHVATDRGASPAIVGAWIVKAPEAPFPLHMFIFHSDGTVEQSNPDAGDPSTSDSNLMGAWVPSGGGFRGKAVEVTADRTTHQFVSRVEISFELTVGGNAFRGIASAVFYDADGKQIKGPVRASLEGQRILP